MNKEEKRAIKDMDRFANSIDMSGVTAKQMQIILDLIKRLQKENETLKNFVSGIVNEKIEKEFIPVQKIRDKIEELKKEKEQLQIDNNVLWDSGIYKLDIKLTALQELLEGED